MKVVKSIANKIRGYESGFGFFIGDQVRHKVTNELGHVLFVFRKTKSIQVAWKDSKLGYFYAAEDTRLESTGIRRHRYPKEVWQEVFEKYDTLSDQVMFIYSMYKCDVKSVAKVLQISEAEVCEELESLKFQGVL